MGVVRGRRTRPPITVNLSFFFYPGEIYCPDMESEIILCVPV